MHSQDYVVQLTYKRGTGLRGTSPLGHPDKAGTLLPCGSLQHQTANMTVPAKLAVASVVAIESRLLRREQPFSGAHARADKQTRAIVRARAGVARVCCADTIALRVL